MLYIKQSSGVAPLTLDAQFLAYKQEMESALFFKPGETITIKGVSCGWFTTGGRDLLFPVPVSKSLAKISSGKLTSAKLIVRQNTGYAIGNGDFETINLSTDMPRVNISGNAFKGSLDIGFTFPTSRARVNNDACGVDYYLTIAFS